MFVCWGQFSVQINMEQSGNVEGSSDSVAFDTEGRLHSGFDLWGHLTLQVKILCNTYLARVALLRC